MSPVPLACIRCNGEVAPERVGFSEELAEKLAFWRNLHRGLMTLWLDSGEYESWARNQLENPSGQVNTRGLTVVNELARGRSVYYWWFQDSSSDDFEPLSRCPRCSEALTSKYGHLVCEPCRILVPNG
jgi:hypothetical protein